MPEIAIISPNGANTHSVALERKKSNKQIFTNIIDEDFIEFIIKQEPSDIVIEDIVIEDLISDELSSTMNGLRLRKGANLKSLIIPQVLAKINENNAITVECWFKYRLSGEFIPNLYAYLFSFGSPSTPNSFTINLSRDVDIRGVLDIAYASHNVFTKRTNIPIKNNHFYYVFCSIGRSFTDSEGEVIPADSQQRMIVNIYDFTDDIWYYRRTETDNQYTLSNPIAFTDTANNFIAKIGDFVFPEAANIGIRGFDGDVFGLRLWNKYVSDFDVIDQLKQLKNPLIINGLNMTEDNLIINMDFNDASGQNILYDISGKGLDMNYLNADNQPIQEQDKPLPQWITEKSIFNDD